MANATKPQVGRSVGHEWAVSLANSGHFYWPPTGSSDWPLTADGTVISSIHRRHRAIGFKRFLNKIDTEVPDQLDVHLVCDNYATHKIPTVTKWLDTHPRFCMHFTPTYSSWINQVKRFFAYVTGDLLQRRKHRSVQALESDTRNWVKGWNEDAKTFIWTKPAEQILDSLKSPLRRTAGARHQQILVQPPRRRSIAATSQRLAVNEPARRYRAIRRRTDSPGPSETAAEYVPPDVVMLAVVPYTVAPMLVTEVTPELKVIVVLCCDV